MNRRSIKHISFLAAILVAATLTSACGGGGGSSGGGGGPATTAMFTADPPGNLSMAAGLAVGADFEVDIRVAGIADMNGASFNVGFDPTKVAFMGFESAGSELADTNATFQAATTDSGNAVAVGIAMLSGGNDGTVTGRLITLQFRAIGTGASRLDFVNDSSLAIRQCPTPTTCTDLVPTPTGGDVNAT